MADRPDSRAGSGTGRDPEPDDGSSGGATAPRSDRGESAPDEAPDGAPASDLSVEQVYFPPEVARFLNEFSRAVQKHSMYPPAHPALRPAVARALAALEPLLETESQLTLGVGRRRIVVGASETDPSSPLMAGLAEQLHAQELAVVTFRTGISAEELAGFLARVSLDPRRSEETLARQIGNEASPWRHVLLQPVRYDGLGMAWSGEASSTEAQKRRADELWLTLASSLLADLADPTVALELDPGRGGPAPSEAPTGDPATDEAGAADGADRATRDVARAAARHSPEDLAEELERGSEDEVYAREAFRRLARVFRDVRSVGGEAGKGLRRRTSRFVSALEPGALESLLRVASDAERHELVRDAARWMDPQSVVKMVRATGVVEGRDLSNPLLLLMAKMARYAGSDALDLAPEAETNLRKQVDTLLADWDREYEVAEPYREALRQIAFDEPEEDGERPEPVGAEPSHVLRIGLLVDNTGPHVWNAATELMRHRQFEELVRALRIADPDSEAAEEVWQELATPKAVGWILTPHPDEEAPPLDLVDRFVARVGPDAAPPLLDRMGHTESPELRKELFVRLEALGSAIAPHLLERLEDGRWWVRRNALALLRRVGGWPATWSPYELSRDPHPEVRAEALALLLRSRDQRDRAICQLLEEPSLHARELGLRAAQEGAPPEAVPHLLAILQDERAALPLRLLALRALAALGPPELLEPLLDLVGRRWGGPFVLLGPLRPVSLEPPSPLMLEGLAAMTAWKEHPEVAPVLRKARRSDDERVKAAAYGRLRGGPGRLEERGEDGELTASVSGARDASDDAPEAERLASIGYVPGPEDAG